jgi:hypothetical protein
MQSFSGPSPSGLMTIFYCLCPRDKASGRIQCKTSCNCWVNLLPRNVVFAEPLPSNGCCVIACFTVVTQQRMCMSQYKFTSTFKIGVYVAFNWALYDFIPHQSDVRLLHQWMYRSAFLTLNVRKQCPLYLFKYLVVVNCYEQTTHKGLNSIKCDHL